MITIVMIVMIITTMIIIVVRTIRIVIFIAIIMIIVITITMIMMTYLTLRDTGAESRASCLLCIDGLTTGVCETITPFARAIAKQSGGRNCIPAPDLVL